jgi:polyhydroxyalkanoate synthesis repressor PhaR
MAETSPSEAPKRLDIRKYPNRRYYDSTRSRHVTLEEILALIREGYEVQITDSKTEEDITAKILGQIIIDLDPPKMGVFPVPLLHRLLRSNEKLVNDFVTRYNQALGAFLDSQRSMEQYLRNAMGVHTPSPTVADWTKLMWSQFNPAVWNGPKGGGAAGAAPPMPEPAPQAQPQAQHPAAESQAVRQQVDELRQQVERLQHQLNDTPRKRRRHTGEAERPRRPHASAGDRPRGNGAR